MTKGLTITLLLSEGKTVQFEKRDSQITEPDGTVIFEMKDVEVPVGWSQLATDILVSKYFRKAGVDDYWGKGDNETSIQDVVSRIVDKIAQFGYEFGYFGSFLDAEAFDNELKYILYTQRGAFNSPVWFNCGLDKYGIKGSGGNFYWNPETDQIEETSDSYSHPQCSACFIQSVDDDLMSIFELAKKEARLFKYGSGTGTNFSKIRGKQEKLSGGGTSSGLLSFLQVLDRGAGATKSGGTTRRAAKMVCLDDTHPELVDFIEWKSKEERKVKALIDAGYPADFNGEAYQTVAGQNSNNSIRLSDKFMRAVENDEEWSTTFRTTGEVCETFRARDLFDKIAQAAWSCADPGVQFDDTINQWHTCLDTDRIYASNPCSEYHFLDNTACNLASINLVKYLNEDGSFDIEGFKHTCRIFIIAQDILVDLASYPTYEIAKNSHEYRPLGLGYANLGSLLMLKGVPYDSQEALDIAAGITGIMHGTANMTSVDLAEVKGPFIAYDNNKKSFDKVQAQHFQVLDPSGVTGFAAPLVMEAVNQLYYSVDQFKGFRNSQVTVLAPTGTIGLLMDCDTTGVEPDFALVKWKKLAGGGYMKIVNQSVPQALRNLGYADFEVKDILDYISDYSMIEGAPHLSDEHLAVFDCANKCGEGKRFIEPTAHIRMMAAVQPFLSGAISKTVNMPNEATVEDIKEIYMQAWKMGLKCVALYRDGSKFSQPLSSVGKKEEVVELSGISEQLKWGEKKRLPQKRTGFTLDSRVGGHKIHLRTGEYEDGTLGEIFIDMFKEGAGYRSILNCFAIAVSIGLKHGVPLQKFVDAFTHTRFEPYGITDNPAIKFASSIVDYIFKVLSNEYIELKTVEDVLAYVESESRTDHLRSLMGDAPFCSECGSITIRNGSCYKCDNCGASQGCS